MGLGGNRGGEKNRIDRGPRTVCRLPEPDAPAEKRILGQGGGVGLGGGQRSSSSAASISARARR